MALLSWGFDDGQNKKDDNLFDTPPIQHIQSVQSSWQPSGSTSTVAQGGTGDSIFSQDNSSQPSQGSQGNYLMSAESDQADAAIAQRRAQEAQARQQAAIDAENNRRQQVAAAQIAKQQQQQPQTKYTPAKQGAKDGGIWGFLKGVGGAVQQGVGALGDIAIEGGGVLDYAGQRLRGIDANQAAQNTTRNTEQLRSLLHNQKDITGANMVGTQDVDQNAANIAAGRGNAQDFAAVGGKGLQAGLDATMFANPTRMVLGGLATRPVVEGASLLSRTMANPALRYAARDAGFFGGLQGVASGTQMYGQTGDLGQSLKTAGQDALIGGVLQGTLDAGGHVVGKGVRAGYQSLVPFANKTMRGLRNPGEFRIGDKIVQLAEDGSGNPVVQERPNGVPQDGNVSFEQPSEQMPPTQQTPPVNPDGTPVRQQPPVADGVVQPTPEMPQTPDQMTPQTPEQAPAQTPVEKAVADVRAQEQATKDAQAAQQAQQPQPDQPQPVADGAIQPVNPVPAVDPNMPTIKAERVKQLQDAKPGASQADEAAINQELQQTQATLPQVKAPELTPAKVPVVGGDKTGQMIRVRQPEVSAPKDVTPVKDNLPNGMGGDAPKGDVTPMDSNLPDGMNDGVRPLLTKQQVADRLITGVNHAEDAKTQLANGLGIPLDSGLEVSDMLKTVGVEGKSAKIIEDSFSNVQKNDAIYNKVQEANRADYVAGKDTNSKIDRKRNAALRDSLDSLSTVMKEIRYIKRQSSVSERAVQALEGIVKYRAVNILTSAGLFERNAAQELVATAFRTAQNPIKTITGMVGYGNTGVSAIKSTYRDIKNVPHGITSKARHASTSVYKIGMTATDALQQTRAGMYRDEIARQALNMGGNKNPSISEIRQLSKRHGAMAEAVAQMYVGADSQVIPRKSALKAGDALMQFLRTGSDADLQAVNKAIERTTTISDGIIKQLEATGKMNGKVGRALMSVVNGTFMFTRVATNATRNAAEIFNPFAPSLVDSIGRTNRSKAGNLALTLKSKPAAYAALAAVPVMYAAGNIGYNDGDDPSKPRGVWIKNPDGSYINSRSTGLFELPIGIMVLSSELYKDAQEGHMRDAGYYSGIVTQSLPYIDTAEQASGAITSVTDALFGGNNGTGDNGYAAKSYGVNTAKSLVPFSNNSVQPYVAGKEGKSLNAKTTYDKNFGKWLGQSIGSSYSGLIPASTDLRNSLKDSRDNAGRVRTVDNQGVFINKTINDANTKTYNSAINDLVKYGRDNKFGNNTQDMFNTYDTGKNNNFKSVQDSLTFLDVPQGGKPDAADKLKSNGKIADLSQQIKNGFYGDTGSELLTLDGQNLKSDASVPTKDGSKNSRLPLSMQSIKNAVAATDLPKDQSDALYALSGKSTELYNQLKAKSISYDQYSAEKDNLAQQQAAILSGSKSYQKLNSLMDKLDQSGFFDDGGLGSTKSGQTYLWNSLNSLLGSKGATPAANYPDTSKAFTPYGRGGSRSGGSRSGGAFTPTTVTPKSFQVTPAQARKMATVAQAKYTPLSVKIKLGNAIKKNKTQNYADRSF